MWSMALWRAVWMIHACGNSGTPDAGHWSTAAAKASGAASSAASKSPKSQIRAATIRPQSERYTASRAEVTSWGMPDDKCFCAGVSICANPVRFTYGGPYEIHVAHLQRREGLGYVQRGPTAGFHGGIHEIHPTDSVGRAVAVEFSVATDVGSHQRARARRQTASDRRPVRRDARATRRLLPHRGQRPRRSPHHARTGSLPERGAR